MLRKLARLLLPKEKNIFSSMAMGLVLAGVFSVAFYVFALPYSPGETTDPSCLPTDANCTVTSSVPYTGATAAVDLGSRNFTTTGAGSLGSLSLTTTSLTVGNGGTGNSSLTAYAILAGGTTSTGALQQVSGLGTSGYVLTSNGAGALPTWQAASGGGASTALDNLASVAINTSLISDTDNTDDLGSSAKEWKDIYIDGTAYLDAIDFNGTAISSTAAQLNYLSGATGTTGTTTTNIVFSTSPTLVTPVLGVASGTSLALSTGGNLLTLTNTTDNASVQTAILQGDRATMAANDEAYLTLRLSDDGGTQTEFSRISWFATDVADTSEDGRLDFSVMTAGTLAKELQLDGTSLAPSTSDGNALGTSAKMWSDLFLASGAVINLDNGDVTATHSANTLTFAGGTIALGAATASTFTASDLITANASLNIANGATSSGILKILEDTDAGSNFATFQVPALAANTVYTLPADDGDAGEQLQTDGSGVLTWEAAGSGSGASTALDNLASVAINAALVLGTSDAFALGSATKQWSDLFLAEGGVINWDNGDITITQTNNVLAIAGTTGTTFDGTATATGFISSASDPADAGIIRLGNAETIAWEAATPGTDLTLTVNSSDILTSSVPISATTGFRIGGSATTGTILASNGTNYVASGVITDGEGIQRNNTSFLSSPIPVIPQGRLTLTTATPVTTSDVTAATTVYYALYKGDVISLYDGTRWKAQRFTEQSIKTTDSAQSGTTSSTTLSGLTDTSQLMRGMLVSGTNVPVGAVIASIDSATQVTLDLACLGECGLATVTFKLPASKNYDIFYVQSSGKLQYSNAWSSDTARADALGFQNGIYMNNAAINSADSNTIAAKTGLYLGTIRTTTTAGQTEDSGGTAGTTQVGGKRFVWNNYNRVPRFLKVIDTADAWTYTTDTWRVVNGATAPSNAVEYVVGLAEDFITASALETVNLASNSAQVARTAIGIDSGTTPSGLYTSGFQASASVNGLTLNAQYDGIPGLGYHYLAWLEKGADTTSSFKGDNGGLVQSGLRAQIMQ